MRLLGRIASVVPASVREPLLFELRSFLGRRLSKRVAVDPARANYLNLGAGDVPFDDYVNLDVYPLPLIERGRPSTAGADLRHPLMFVDASFDGVFSEHTFEHLTYDQVERLLRECARVLKPRGRIRVIVPDLSLFIRAYCAGDDSWFREWERLYFTDSADAERAKRRLIAPMNAISFVTQEYGHVSAWDFEILEALLQRNGFAEITKTAHREGADPRLLRDLDEPDRKFVSLHVEAVKA